MNSAEQDLEEALKLERAAVLTDSPGEQLELLRAAERHLLAAIEKLCAHEGDLLD